MACTPDNGTGGRSRWRAGVPGPPAGPVTDGVDRVKMQAAIDRQNAIDVGNRFADRAAEVDELRYDSGGDEIARERLHTRITREHPDWTSDQVRADVDRVLADPWADARAAQMSPVGEIGSTERFDPGRHSLLGHRPRPGEAVQILRSGTRYDPEEILTRPALAVALADGSASPVTEA